MLKKLLYYLALLSTIFFISACSGPNLSSSKSSGDDVNWEVGGVAAKLVKKLTSNRTFYEDEGPAVAITSFYYLDQDNQSMKLSMILAESIIHQMQKQGYRPIDYKLMPTVKMSANGSYVFTKNMEELREKGFVNLVLIGTLTELFDGILINARIIDIRTGVVVSSSQAILDKSIIETIFEEPEYRKLYTPQKDKKGKKTDDKKGKK